MPQSFAQVEINSQPDCWRRSADLAKTAALPESGARLAVVGCGTSWFVAQAFAVLRETSGHGVTDAFTASELPMTRSYDHVLAISRSGTTSEVLRVLDETTTRTTVITGVPSAIGGRADAIVDLSHSDERSVVQTRFATSALALLRAHLGEDLEPVIAQTERLLTEPLPAELLDTSQFTFLGTGWTIGLAHEAALKLREAAGAWTESYPALEYRHGPITIAEPGRVTWMFGEPPQGMADEVRQTGANFVQHSVDPMADLVTAQSLALKLAYERGLDPDRPRHLARSVVLDHV